MALRKRNLQKRASTLDSNAQAWLRGDKSCGLFKFKPQGEFEELWSAYGDDANMFWRSRYCLPITREELEAREGSWLNAADVQVHYRSLAASFINSNYADDEREELWEERGDDSRFQFERGMMWPQAIV
jgi:hypothetical protein